jgi:hypothetical protein
MNKNKAQKRKLTEAQGLTVGDVKYALDYARKKKLGKATGDVGKILAKQGGKALLGFLTAGISDRVSDIFSTAIEAGEVTADAIGAFYPALAKSSPKEKESNPIWDLLTIDPDTAAIVDDTVENKFLIDLKNKIANLPDDAPLPDADEQLANWTKRNYSDTVIKKEKNESLTMLKLLIRETLHSLDGR